MKKVRKLKKVTEKLKKSNKNVINRVKLRKVASVSYKKAC